jgi:hypothetical protein
LFWYPRIQSAPHPIFLAIAQAQACRTFEMHGHGGDGIGSQNSLDWMVSANLLELL